MKRRKRHLRWALGCHGWNVLLRPCLRSIVMECLLSRGNGNPSGEIMVLDRFCLVRSWFCIIANLVVLASQHGRDNFCSRSGCVNLQCAQYFLHYLPETITYILPIQ
ncbi:hypothetical protein BRADI_5g06636v3 [Brachypodium distachyon]|uniref:Uncharacterized protein n=1 Tax=Brachypodium distachyon TaxID=15368 RepID=A0A0Q3E2Y4_BRADI|nr:hypothetical protein BRADI_5g06636v3 [Brachypodium distachyon]